MNSGIAIAPVAGPAIQEPTETELNVCFAGATIQNVAKSADCFVENVAEKQKFRLNPQS
jgi:hypothetical protein